MADRTQKTDHKTPRRRAKPLSLVTTACGVFLVTLSLTLLSFISLDLAILSFGVLMIGSLLYFENRRRNFWEMGASFKFHTIFETQKAQDKDLLRNGFEIEGLKQDIKDIKTDLKKIKMREPSAITVPSLKEQEPPPTAVSKPEPARKVPAPDMHAFPKALRPGMEFDHDFPDEPPPPASDEIETLSETVIRELLHHAVQHKRVDVFVQPIVRLPQRQVRFYEMFARIRARPGQYLPAEKYMPIAEQDNLQHEIDDLLLLHCLKTIQASSRIERATPFFLNITAATLKNPGIMKRLLVFLSHHRDLAGRLVFELPHSEFTAASASIREIIRGLGKLGCAFSLDHIRHMNFDIQELQDYKVRTIKMNAEQLISPSVPLKERGEALRAKRLLESNSIGVIIQKIESEGHMRELLDLEVHYGQGYLFGRPEPQGAYANRSRVRRTTNENEQDKRA